MKFKYSSIFLVGSMTLIALLMLNRINVFSAETNDISINIIQQPIPFLGKIAFIRHVDGKHVFVIDGSTSKIKRLTDNDTSKPIFYINPKWSPDGKYIAFTNSGLFHDRNIFIIKSDGSGFKKLTHFSNVSINTSIKWDESGKNVLFYNSRTDDKLEKGWYKVNILKGTILKSKAVTKIKEQKLWNEAKTMYAVLDSELEFIEIYDAKGDLRAKIRGGPLGEIYRWSPDTRSLIYCEGCEYEHIYPRIRYLNVETGKSYLITNGEDADWYYEIDSTDDRIATHFKTRTYAGNKIDYGETYIAEKFTRDDNFNKRYLKALRNEIFARHGRQFESLDLQYIFGVCDWYKPNPNYSDDMLNDIEKENIQFIIDYEKKMGWR